MPPESPQKRKNKLTLSAFLNKEATPRRGLCWFEWVMIIYALATFVFIAVFFGRLNHPGTMIMGRILAMLMTAALWGAYRLWPCRLIMTLRVAAQILLLSWWYPDTYELNVVFPNLDHIFASWEQALFGCQPALLFSQNFPSPWVSELLSLGYVSYYPMIAAVAFYYCIRHYDRFLYCSYVILGAFFLFYVIFIFLPVVGPQYYYMAVGTDQIAQGFFPDLGYYFHDHQASLTIPGYKDGFVYHLLHQAHDAGERPTAAFPSSHVVISVVLLWLAYEARSRKLFYVLLPLSVLMFFATFYIQAHYAIDAIAGIFVGTAIYFLLRHLYKPHKPHESHRPYRPHETH